MSREAHLNMVLIVRENLFHGTQEDDCLYAKPSVVRNSDVIIIVKPTVRTVAVVMLTKHS